MSKYLLLLVLVTTAVAPATRYADIFGAMQKADAEKASCMKEGHSQRYCEWLFNKEHWPYEDTSPYWTFEEYMKALTEGPTGSGK